ncbi:flagellar brake protein [Undibacterium arcticum]|uniref:Flagellar brake protein YcgR n=1 Tax=Undibacterium arcticum TaxID=1762892 RepID=A0ABV7F3N5_9BURK
MQSDNNDLGTEVQNHYQVQSRREILAILRNLAEKNQLVSVSIDNGAEVAVTTILEVDNDAVILDCAPDPGLNQRIIAADHISFETSLDKIRIVFSAAEAESCEHEGRPAIAIGIPASLIRLQRREYYRINTPVTNPLRCTIPLPEELGGGAYTMSLVDISCGGIAVLDDKKTLDKTIGRNYQNCRVDILGIGTIVVTLQIRSSQDMTLLNGKVNRRLGCQFIDLPNSMLTVVQRYIMKLERERNSKATGLG